MGRSPYADIVIADPSVAEYHAEIVVTDDGRIFAVDCGTAAGTWRLVSKGEHAGWRPIRQAFIGRDDVLRFGEHERLVLEILSPAAPQSQTGTDDALRREAMRPGGRLSRDLATGEVVRRRS